MNIQMNGNVEWPTKNKTNKTLTFCQSTNFEPSTIKHGFLFSGRGKLLFNIRGIQLLKQRLIARLTQCFVVG